jgi:crossover junction endodeoxyribonuclease RusA
MADELDLELPWPPSVNTYWRHPSSGPLAGRHLISGKGRLYRTLVAGICHLKPMVQGPLSVEIMAYPPDRRVRDLDNILKSLLDALVHANVIADDGQIDRLLIERQSVLAGGKVVLQIRRINNEKNI